MNVKSSSSSSRTRLSNSVAESQRRARLRLKFDQLRNLIKEGAADRCTILSSAIQRLSAETNVGQSAALMYPSIIPVIGATCSCVITAAGVIVECTRSFLHRFRLPTDTADETNSAIIFTRIHPIHVDTAREQIRSLLSPPTDADEHVAKTVTSEWICVDRDGTVFPLNVVLFPLFICAEPRVVITFLQSSPSRTNVNMSRSPTPSPRNTPTEHNRTHRVYIPSRQSAFSSYGHHNCSTVSSS